jgi:hypothetical protein
VRSVHGFSDNRFRANKSAHYLTKSIAAIAHRQQFEMVLGPGMTPPACNRLGGFARGERALEFVRDDEGLHSPERMKIRGTAQEVNDWNFSK